MLSVPVPYMLQLHTIIHTAMAMDSDLLTITKLHLFLRGPSNKRFILLIRIIATLNIFIVLFKNKGNIIGLRVFLCLAILGAVDYGRWSAIKNILANFNDTGWDVDRR